MFMSSVCIVLLVLVGRGGRGDGCWGRSDLISQLTLGKGPAGMGIRNHVQRAAIPSKGSFLV